MRSALQLDENAMRQQDGRKGVRMRMEGGRKR